MSEQPATSPKGYEYFVSFWYINKDGECRHDRIQVNSPSFIDDMEQIKHIEHVLMDRFKEGDDLLPCSISITNFILLKTV